MGVGQHMRLILLSCVFAGALAIPSWQPSQESQGQSDLSKSPLEGCNELDMKAGMLLTGSVLRLANGTDLQLYPASEAHVHEHVMGTRRKLGVFRQCSPCTCCDRTRRWCLPTVCCYNIRCGLQGLPYGLCSFIPISCTCYGCQDD